MFCLSGSRLRSGTLKSDVIIYDQNVKLVICAIGLFLHYQETYF